MEYNTYQPMEYIQKWSETKENKKQTMNQLSGDPNIRDNIWTF